MAALARFKTLFLGVTEAGFTLIAFIVLLYLLLGEASGSFVTGVIANISVMVNVLTPNVLIGLALVLFLAVLARRRP